MIINFREIPYSPETAQAHARAAAGTPGMILINGEFVPRAQMAWFIDTEAGIVKTYDVFGDRRTRSVREVFGHTVEQLRNVLIDGEAREIEAPLNGAISETLRGKVELVYVADPGCN